MEFYGKFYSISVDSVASMVAFPWWTQPAGHQVWGFRTKIPLHCDFVEGKMKERTFWGHVIRPQESWHPVMIRSYRSLFPTKTVFVYVTPLLSPSRKFSVSQRSFHTLVQHFYYGASGTLQNACLQFILGFLFSPLGYAPNDMPVKAKRSTYNYSLPITVKKPGKLCQQIGCLALLFLWVTPS